MRFELQGSYVFYHDEIPGNHATLFNQSGEKLIFVGDASRFDDGAHHYTWAFLANGAVSGERVCFATTEREIVGRVGAVGEQVPLGRYVRRDATGKPVGIG